MRRILVTTLCLLTTLTLWATDIYFSGESSISTSVSIPPVEDPWKITGASINQSFEVDAYGDTTALYLNAGFVYDAVDNSLKPFLSELYADLFIDKAAFRFGRQKGTWGNAEIESAVDVITPADMSDPILMEKSAINALKASYDAFPFAIELFWIPVFSPAILPASAMDMYSMIPVIKPELSLENSEFGAKASAYTSAGDFALYGYYGWEDTPSLHGEYPYFQLEYDRLVMAGASAAVPVGEVTLKAEAAWYPERGKTISAMAGLEWIKNDLTFITEVYGEWDKEEDELSGQVGASVSYDFLDGDLELSIAGILELRELDGAAIAGVSYSFTDELKATASVVYIFEGPDEAGTYGAFKDLDCVRLGATYSF